MGKIALQALFNREVLPQSFSPCQNLMDQDKDPKVSRKSFCNEAKQKPNKACIDKMQDDAQNMIVNQNQACNGDAHSEDCACGCEIPKAARSSAQVKEIQDSEAIANSHVRAKHNLQVVQLSALTVLNPFTVRSAAQQMMIFMKFLFLGKMVALEQILHFSLLSIYHH